MLGDVETPRPVSAATGVVVKVCPACARDGRGPFVVRPMRYALTFRVLGILLAMTAVRLAREADGTWWLLVAAEAHGAACLLGLAAVYGLRHAGVPVEDALVWRGWSWAARPLLLPYTVLARLTLLVTSRLSRELLLSPVGPGLCVGRLPFPWEWDRLEGIDAVLSLCWEFPPGPPRRGAPGREVACVPILDGAPPSDRQFRRAVGWVESQRRAGRTVLIHCAQGHGRSATVAAAVLCRLGLAADAEDALATVLRSRPRARPSRAQGDALRRFLSTP
jgi:hypothetical protein